MSGTEGIVHECDVLVIGGGAGGCMAALKAKEAGAREVIQLDKGYVGRSGPSAFAAGILQAFCPAEDDYDQVFQAIVKEAGYIVDQDRLQFHLEAAWPTVEELVSFGVEVERKEDGKIRRHPGRGTGLGRPYKFHPQPDRIWRHAQCALVGIRGPQDRLWKH